MELQVNVEKTSEIQRKLHIKVPAKTVAQRLEQGFSQVQRTAKLKGFRPGHVPITVVKQQYGEDVRHQVFHNLIDESYREALRKEKIMAVGSPQIETPDHKTGAGDHDHTIREDQDLNYTVTVEVLPEIKVKSYTGFALTQESTDVNDADVEKTIEDLRNSQAQLVPATAGLVGADGSASSRPVRKGDFVEMTFSGGIVTDSGIEKKEGMSGNRMIEVGTNQLIEGFEDNLIDMRAGETKTFRVTFPKDYASAEVAGKEAEFTATINEVKEKQLPELTDEFVKQMGYEGLADLRVKARQFIESEKKQDSDRKLRSDLLQQLIEKNPFDCPESLVQAQTRALAQEVAQNLKQQGFNDQMIQEALGQELPNLKVKAENQVKASLLIEAIAKSEGISVTPDEIEAELTNMAASMKVEEARVREYYEKNPNKREDLEFRMREDRTVKFLLEKSKVKKAK